MISILRKMRTEPSSLQIEITNEQARLLFKASSSLSQICEHQKTQSRQVDIPLDKGRSVACRI
jgi:hypothetical protein